MITLLIIIGALFVLGLGLLAFDLSKAPEAHEDRGGFHVSKASKRSRRKQSEDDLHAAHAAH